MEASVRGGPTALIPSLWPCCFWGQACWAGGCFLEIHLALTSSLSSSELIC